MKFTFLLIVLKVGENRKIVIVCYHASGVWGSFQLILAVLAVSVSLWFYPQKELGFVSSLILLQSISGPYICKQVQAKEDYKPVLGPHNREDMFSNNDEFCVILQSYSTVLMILDNCVINFSSCRSLVTVTFSLNKFSICVNVFFLFTRKCNINEYKTSNKTFVLVPFSHNLHLSVLNIFW